VGARSRRASSVLNRYRRHFAVLAFLLLATPLVAGVILPVTPAAIIKEGRNLAPAPKAPLTRQDWLLISKQIDAYLQDHFGLRQVMIRLHKDLTKPMLGFGNDSVLIGRDGRMFYLGEEAVRQSAGLVFRDQRVADTADLLVSINEALKVRGIRFLVASPPNSATIYQDDLPQWARNRRRQTEYGALIENLASRGVRTIDLRPTLRAAQAEGPAYYMHDTHWTPRGALAAFNAVAEADSHADWRIEAKSALGPLTSRKGGDLARMFGVQDNVSEQSEDLALPAGTKVLLSSDPFGDYVETSNKPGPTIMIIGDSFTGGDFATMAAQHAGRVIWVDHRHCGFDWAAIDKFHPDEVWWTPNERFLICGPGLRPVDFTG
jgi:alginate O-acetyltransferase complex protein AlgJ